MAEAPGEIEVERGLPLVGPSGGELRRMMATVGMDLRDCFKTNVFNVRPDANNLHLFGADNPSPQSRALGPFAHNPNAFLGDEHFHHLERLYAELSACRPNVIVALGNTACWALLGQSGINALRGTIHTANIPGMDRPVKVLPTYHPAAILRQWDQRVIALADLEKARVEADFPELNFQNTELWLEPTLPDLDEFGARYMETATICATDVETKRGQITCISFAPSVDHSLTVPFWIEGDAPNYWPDPQSEALAWAWVRKWLERESLTKVMQNGLYDVQYMIAHGIRPRGCTEDTMLAHHSLYSELKKGLGFLGSIYANVPGWKKMRTFKREELLKRDE